MICNIRSDKFDFITEYDEAETTWHPADVQNTKYRQTGFTTNN